MSHLFHMEGKNMTTKVTVDAHAGWPVKVEALDYEDADSTESETTELAVVQPGEVQNFHVHSTRQLIITELPEK